MENNQEKNLILAEALPRAMFVGLKTVLYLFILPYKIWKSSTLRLGAMYDKTLLCDHEEFPALTFTKITIDALIVIWPLLALFLSVFDAFSKGGSMTTFFGIIFSAYFLIPFFSFSKEIITLSLAIVSRLEEVSKNTKGV
jgi:hypothetical protein